EPVERGGDLVALVVLHGKPPLPYDRPFLIRALQRPVRQVPVQDLVCHIDIYFPRWNASMRSRKRTDTANSSGASETMGCPFAGDPIHSILRPVDRRREFANSVGRFTGDADLWATRHSSR
ncbi:MAG: hypothetical protein ACM34D_15370, partial [Gemmatimonadota bacterium]